MAGRSPHASARRRASGHARKLAVYHASASVEPHIAELRRTKRFKLLCFPQRTAARMRAPTTAVDAVLWELRPGRKPNLRRLNSIARGRPLVSYSVDRGRQVADQSRAFGFTSHLTAPLIPVEIEHQLVLAAPVDLATRFRQFQPTLRRYLNRVPVIGEMTRVVNASMDPDRVADALVARAAGRVAARPLLGGGRGGSRRRREADGRAGAGARCRGRHTSPGRLGSAPQPGIYVGRSSERPADAWRASGRGGCVSPRVSWPHGGSARGCGPSPVRPRAENFALDADRGSAGCWSRPALRSITLSGCSAPRRCRSPTI